MHHGSLGLVLDGMETKYHLVVSAFFGPHEPRVSSCHQKKLVLGSFLTKLRCLFPVRACIGAHSKSIKLTFVIVLVLAPCQGNSAWAHS